MKYKINWSVITKKEWVIKDAFIEGEDIIEINRKFYEFLKANNIDEDKNYVTRQKWEL